MILMILKSNFLLYNTECVSQRNYRILGHCVPSARDTVSPVLEMQHPEPRDTASQALGDTAKVLVRGAHNGYSTDLQLAGMEMQTVGMGAVEIIAEDGDA